VRLQIKTIKKKKITYYTNRRDRELQLILLLFSGKTYISLHNILIRRKHFLDTVCIFYIMVFCKHFTIDFWQKWL